MNYENFDNLGDTLEYTELKEAGTADLSIIEDAEELKVLELATRLCLVKSNYNEKTASNNVKIEIKQTGAKVTTRKGDCYGVLVVTVKSVKDVKDDIMNILRTYTSIEKEYDEVKGEYTYNPKCKYGSWDHIELNYNNDRTYHFFGRRYYD